MNLSSTHGALRRKAGGSRPFALAILVLGVALLVSGCENTSARGTEVVVELPPLTATSESPEALAKAFLTALQEKDREKLISFALSEEEFRSYVWPELPSSETWPFEYGWNDLKQKSLNSLTRTYNRFGGEELDLVELRFDDETTDYGSYRVHRDARVRVRRANGKEEWLDLFGSVMEYQGRYKLFSYVTD